MFSQLDHLFFGLFTTLEHVSHFRQSPSFSLIRSRLVLTILSMPKSNSIRLKKNQMVGARSLHQSRKRVSIAQIKVSLSSHAGLSKGSVFGGFFGHWLHWNHHPIGKRREKNRRGNWRSEAEQIHREKTWKNSEYKVDYQPEFFGERCTYKRRHTIVLRLQALKAKEFQTPMVKTSWVPQVASKSA